MATVIEIDNPFEPFNETRVHENVEGISILDWLRENKDENWESFVRPTICIYNGKPLLLDEYGDTQLSKDDVVSFCALVGDPISIIIAVVVAVVAVAVVLSIIPQPPAVGDTPEADPTFTLRGQQNAAKLGQTIPSHYGRIKNWPDYAAQPYNQYIGNQQYQFSLFCCGEGYYAFEGNGFIEDTPVGNYDDVDIWKYDPGQNPAAFPNAVVTSDEVGSIELFGPNEPEYVGNTGPYNANEVQTTATRLEVDIVLPRGLYYSNDDGGLDGRTISAIILYQQINDSGVAIGPWLTLVNFNKSLTTNTPQRYTYGVNVPAGRYRVQGRRTNNKDTSTRAANVIVWESLRAFLPHTNDFGEVTLIAMRAKASNSLNDNSRFRYNIYQTRKLPIFNGATWSAPVATTNPIWAMCDILRAEYGGNLDSAFIDLEYLRTLAATYDSRGDEFNWSFSRKTNVWDACRMALSVGRAIPMLNGSQVTAIRDEIKIRPQGVFTPDNMISGSFDWSLKMFELNSYDGLEVEYLDEVTWKQKTVLCLVGNDVGDNPRKMKLDGVTDRTKAYREGLFQRAKEVFQREAISFTTGLEGHLPNIGSLITVTHDVPKWGQFGSIVEYENNIMLIDVELEFEIGKSYRMIFRKRDGSGTISYAVQPSDTSLTKTDLVRVVDVFEAGDEDFVREHTQEPVFFQFGESNNVTKYCRVKEIMPGSEGEVDIKCVNNDDRVYNFDNEIPPEEDEDSTPVIPDLPGVTGVTVLPIPNSTNQVQVTWQPAVGALSYVVERSYDNETWTQLATTQVTSMVVDVFPGYAYFRVAGINVEQGAWGLWEGSVGTATAPPLNVSGLSLQSAFIGTTCKIQWNSVSTATSYIIQVKRASSGALLREVEVTATTYTYGTDQSMVDFAGSPQRDLRFDIVARNSFGDSETPQTLLATNPKPSIPSNITYVLENDTANSVDVVVNWTLVPENDIKEYALWASDTTGFTEDNFTEVARGSFDSARFTVDKTLLTLPDDYYFTLAAFDLWGDDYDSSPEQTVTIT